MSIQDSARRLGRAMGSGLKWLALALAVGCTVGVAGGCFGLTLGWANRFRAAHGWLIYLLPLGGAAIAFAYSRLDPGGGSANQALRAARTGEHLPLRAAPMIFLSTAMTHLLGGSAGREGAALLLGGSLSGTAAKALHLEGRDSRLMTMCGMSAGFAAVFGTPVAAAVFTLEVGQVGAMPYAALVPVLVSALAGAWVSNALGLAPEAFTLAAEVSLTPGNLARVAALGILMGLLAVAFCEVLHGAHKLFARAVPNPWLRGAAGGAVLIALTLALGTDYNGVGSAVLEEALAGEALPWAFLCKLLFTAVTLGSGFKGGEIVPIFFTGATFGCVVGPLLGLPAGLAAALGMLALFCGCTNTPLATLCLAAELFGGKGFPLFALACAVSYVVSGKCGLYSEQQRKDGMEER